MDIYAYIDQAFNPNGVIVGMGGRFVQEQYQYAMNIADVLMNPDGGLGVVEAETGVGKSLGYLVPCMIFLATHDIDEQIIVSTFTRILQKQILNKDLLFAQTVVEKLGLIPPSSGYRMGRNAFFSIERTRNVVQRLATRFSHDTAYVEQLDRFLQFALDSVTSGSGLWLDWLDEYFQFPDRISSKDICLLYSGTIDNQAYINHLNASSGLKLLVTNHATVIGNDNISEFVESAYMLIVDEAHHVPNLMTERMNKTLPIARLEYLYQSCRLFDFPMGNIADARKILTAWLDVVAQYDREHGADDDFYVSSGGHKEWLLQQVEYVKLLLVALNKIEKHINGYQSNHQLNGQQVEYIDYLQEAIHALSFWVSANDFYYRALLFSENTRNVSFAVVNPVASRLFGHICKKLTLRTVITSATLMDSRDPDANVPIVGDLGFEQLDVLRMTSLSPQAYGEMRFVLANRDLPVPTSYDGELRQNRFNDDWLDYTAAMIKEASKTGATLVLTYSFEESRLLNDRLHDLGVQPITQMRGQKLLECLPSFLNGESPILITPSGWDGLNIRTHDDLQLLSNIVITRIPNSPKNELEDFVAKEYMLSKNMPLHVVENILWKRHIGFCIRTLRQGLGRGLRSPNDSVFVWFADPRMPLYHSPKAKPLINAIPVRFLPEYEQAVIYNYGGQFSPSTPNYSEIDIVL